MIPTHIRDMTPEARAKRIDELIRAAADIDTWIAFGEKKRKFMAAQFKKREERARNAYRQINVFGDRHQIELAVGQAEEQYWRELVDFVEDMEKRRNELDKEVKILQSVDHEKEPAYRGQSE